MSTLPDKFQSNGHTFQVFPKLNAKEHRFEQISEDHYLVKDALSKTALDEYKHIGLKAISEGQLCVLVLCGGQASRLGGDVPKGSLSLSLGGRFDTLISLQEAQIVKLLRMAKAQFPDSHPRILWLVMVSRSTEREIRRHLTEVAKDFNIPLSDIQIFEQPEIPTFDFNGHVLYKSKDEIFTAPNGNGGIYEVIGELLPELEKQAIKYFHVYCVDNILCRVGDPAFIGHSIKVNADCSAKVIEKRHPDEKLGVICMDSGSLPMVLEYSELPKDMAELRVHDNSKLAYRAGSIANHFFTLDFLKKVSQIDLKYHIATKKITYYDKESDTKIVPSEPNGIKLERFIFDVFPASRNFYVFEVDRESEFSPLKNADHTGVDCPTTCRRDLARVHASWLSNLGIQTEKTIFISPLTSYDGEDLNREQVEDALKKVNGNWLSNEN